jgi:NDP-sugar pyrophosphorylase family protein
VTDLSHDLLSPGSTRTEGPPVKAVVLAGGRGTRLAPFTTVLPKPLMPIGETTILEIVLGQLETCGISDVTLCVGYLSHLIKAVISDRVSGGVNVTYVHEKEALGTAGPLRFVEDLTSTFLVMNGDVLTTLRFDALVEHHRKEGNLLTIATRERPIKIDYGVLHLGMNGSSNRVFSYHEKPELTSVVSMGIYVLEPEVLSHIPDEGAFDFPTLVQALLAAELPVGAYPFVDGEWFDIGQRADYERAVDVWLNGMAPAEETASVEPGTGRL